MNVESGNEAGIIGGLASLRVSGAETQGFLQRMLANDVVPLAVGDWQWNVLLSPQGRVLALFRLLRRAESEFLLVLPEVQRTAARETLGRYRLRAKVEIVEDDRRWIGGWIEQQHAERGSLLRDPMISSDGRFLAAISDASSDNQERAAEARWRAADVASGVPWIDAQGLDAQTPQALSLDRLAAYSVRKGCYPGQEIVSRLHFLGQSKRSLRRFASKLSVEPGAELTLDGSDGRPMGSVVACVGQPENIELLAVCQNVDAAAEFHMRGVPHSALQPLALQPPPLPVDRILRESA